MSQNHLFAPPERADAIRIIPLGGCGEFGMNLTCYFYDKKLYVVDAGVRFPDPIKLGTDAVIPHVDPLFEKTGVYAYVMTHGHEDHIGAMPYILPRWPAPVYGTAWTISLIRLKLERHGIDPSRFSLIQVDAGDKIVEGDLSIEFVPMNHSIPMTCALYMKSKGGNVFHTGDFKFDDRPVLEPPAAWSTLARIADEGVDLIIADSTNAQTAGSCPGEASVLQPLTDVLRDASGAVVISTFASNLWRLKTIVDACRAVGRKLYVTGPGCEQTFAVASALGLYDVPDGVRVDDDGVGRTPRDKLLVLATGCQGEYRSALARIAKREHRAFKIEQGDTVVLSSRIIPGNEKAIHYVLNDVLAQGATVVTAREVNGIHVSGHAYRGDLDRLLKTLRPKRYLPMHGGFSQLLANWEVGIGHLPKAGDARIMQNGDVLELTPDGLGKLGAVEIEIRYVDGESRVILSPEVLRDRLKLGELGGALVTGAYDPKARRWVAPPQVELLGLAFPPKVDAEDSLEKLEDSVRTRFPQLVTGKKVDLDTAYEEMRVALRRQLAGLLKKKPVVLVKIQLV